MSFFRTLKISISSCGCLHQQQHVRQIHQTAPRFVTPKGLKGKSTSSQEWMTRHLNDPYVHKAKKQGYRARSAFKLLELDAKFTILKPGQVVIDCGAAPGAWSQVTVKKVNSDGAREDIPQGKVIAIDLLPIDPILGAITIPNCDFTDAASQEKILQLVHNRLTPEEGEELSFDNKERIIDVVLSDMAPNASGIAESDHYKILNLVKCALDFALQHAKKNSSFLGKIWMGAGADSFIEQIKTHYKIVKTTKPTASRQNSSEMFIYATKKIK